MKEFLAIGNKLLEKWKKKNVINESLSNDLCKKLSEK